MQTLKKSSQKSRNEKCKDTETSIKNSQAEKLRSMSENVATPRNYMQKSSTADIYGQRNKNMVSGAKAPKKLANVSYKSSDGSPMKDLLKSSSSSASVVSKFSDTKHKKVEVKVTPRKTTKVEVKATSRSISKVETKAPPRTSRDTPRRNLPFSNVTVSSPIVKRKLNLEHEVCTPIKPKKVEREKSNRSINEELNKHNMQDSVDQKAELVFERQRTKTRTLEEDEVKMLTPDAVDNNASMMDLSRKLTAQPKAFFVNLEEGEMKIKNEVPSEEEVSYEDDFESYESDFESYHSESNDDKSTHATESSVQNESDEHDEALNDDHVDNVKDGRDEERMLDSGSYDLRDRSAKSKVPIMENIIEDEDAEDGGNKKVSLPDEGFQEMSSSSAISSMKTVHVDVLERPLFIDFKKSKEVKRKRRIFERLKNRAEVLLGMISLHEMTYSLYEMKPISYDLFMTSFGRHNYFQTGVQTFDDGVSEEVQTDEIIRIHKWTQNPVKFSKSDIYLNHESDERKYSVVTVNYLTKFSFLSQQNEKPNICNEVKNHEKYKGNPLRIYLEQRDGVGSSEMLSYEKYVASVNNKKYDSYKLGRFLKKIESRISNMLSLNTGNTDLELTKSTKLPFSEGFTSLNLKSISNENYAFLKHTTISLMFFSESKSNLIITVHKQSSTSKYVMCLWDVNVVRREPVRTLTAVNNVVIGRFRGSTDGVVVSGLEDGTIHLWDLSEESAFIPNINNDGESTKFVDINLENLTDFERDREWNLKNSNIKKEQQFNLQCALQTCAYTSSGHIMGNGEVSDRIVGLEFTSPKTITLDGKKRILGQVVSLQCTGVLIMWTIVQEKNKSITDIGQAYWAKMKLEKSQMIHLNDHIDNSFVDKMGCFSLNSAKKRLMNKKYEKSVSKNARQKSAAINFGVGRSRATSARNRIENKMLSVQNVFNSGLICNDLKIMVVEGVENILVAKNGEVLCCKRYLGVFKVQRFCIASEASSVTSLQVSPHGLPLFLAATDIGAVNLCSLFDKKVLHTLDCRNVPPREILEKYHSDAKGRFVGSVSVSNDNHTMETKGVSKMFVTSLVWSQVNPCCIYAVLKDGAVVAWDLAQSDIYGRTAGEKATTTAAADSAMAILTSDEEVQIHRFKDEQRCKENVELFKKYIKLL